jgi:helix-turn-helix protein
MGRRENPIDPAAGVLARFSTDLRELRVRAGSPTYRELALRAFYSASTLSQAASGTVVPSHAVTLAFVSVCGGDVAEWDRRWQALDRALAQEHRARLVAS